MRFTTCLIATLASMILLNCGKKEEKTTFKTDDGNKVTITQKGKDGTVIIKGEGTDAKITIKESGPGKVTMQGTNKGEKFQMSFGESGVKLPDNFPKDVPIYPDSTLKTTSSRGESQFMVSIQTDDSAEEVFTFYKKELVEKDWKLESETRFSMGQTSQIAFSAEKVSWELTLSIIQTEQNKKVFTIISIMLEKQE